MRKFLIEPNLKELESFKTKTLTAEEDLIWYRFNKLHKEKLVELNKDKQAIAEQAVTDGVVFDEQGQPDESKSDAEALKKANEKTVILLNEEFDAKMLPITLLNKLKIENEISSLQYNALLDLYLKEQ